MRCAIALAALLLIACGQGDTEAPAADSAKSEVSAAGSVCNDAFVRGAVEQYAEATNSGSAEAIEAALADEPAFRVFSHSLDHRRQPERFFSSKDEARVVAHLTHRADKGDRLRLAQLDIGNPDRSFRVCNIGFVVWRDIGDRARRGERFVGKGAVSMDGGIAVWNTGPPKRYVR